MRIQVTFVVAALLVGLGMPVVADQPEPDPAVPTEALQEDTQQEDPPERVARFKTMHADDLGRRFAYAGTASDRNRHVMSGRVR